MSTDFHIFHGPARGATAFQIACVAVAAVVVSQMIDAYVMHDLLRGSGFPAARLIAATMLGGALASVPALRRMCRELLDAPPARSAIELAAAAALLVAFAFAALGLLALATWAWGGEPALARRMTEPTATLYRWVPDVSLEPAARGELAAVLLVGAIEDIVLLGLLFPAWTLQWGWMRACIATAAVAAAAHPDMLLEFATVLLLVAVLRRTSSLLACIVVHASANVAAGNAFLGRFLLPDNRITGEINSWSFHLACLAAAWAGAIVYTAVACGDEEAFDRPSAFPQR